MQVVCTNFYLCHSNFCEAIIKSFRGPDFWIYLLYLLLGSQCLVINAERFLLRLSALNCHSRNDSSPSRSFPHLNRAMSSSHSLSVSCRNTHHKTQALTQTGFKINTYSQSRLVLNCSDMSCDHEQ